MTATDPALVAALARLIVLHRETYFNDADAIAERHDMTPEAVAECVGWFKTTVEPRYRGTAILAAASELATRMRHGPPIMAAAERRPEASGGAGEKHHVDPVDPDRPERGCARCGGRFRPTMRRRLLCRACYFDDGRAGPENMTQLLNPATPK